MTIVNEYKKSNWLKELENYRIFDWQEHWVLGERNQAEPANFFFFLMNSVISVSLFETSCLWVRDST